jgi:hypothetical protein
MAIGLFCDTLTSEEGKWIDGNGRGISLLFPTFATGKVADREGVEGLPRLVERVLSVRTGVIKAY